MNLKDIKVGEYEISLSKLMGSKIVDVVGYISSEFGTDTLVFKVSKIVLENGVEMWVEGEHDCAYIPTDDDLKEETLIELYKQTRDYDGEFDDED